MKKSAKCAKIAKILQECLYTYSNNTKRKTDPLNNNIIIGKRNEDQKEREERRRETWIKKDLISKRYLNNHRSTLENLAIHSVPTI